MMFFTCGSSCTPRCTAWAITLDATLADTLPTPGTVRATWFRRDHFLVELDTAYGPMTAIATTHLAPGTEVGIRADLRAAVLLHP